MKQNNVNPVGLKGNEVLSRMKDLMGITPITENVNNRSVVEFTKIGPDGKTYGIVRENQDYFIKTTNKNKNVIAEDFQYIGGLKNKREKVYESYAKALKQLNLTFLSLSESAGKTNTTNSFLNDNLIKENDAEAIDEVVETEENEIAENDAACGIVRGKGHDKHIMEIDVEMNDNEKSIDEMITGEKEISESKKPLSIISVMTQIDDVISETTNDRVLNLLENLSPREKAIMLEALKKKV